MFHHLLAAGLALVLPGTAPAGDTPGTGGDQGAWYACEVSSECRWVLGEGGWPAAVRADRSAAFQEWVRARAPFTTYFEPGECFATADELRSYVARSRSRVACVELRCAVTIEPNCSN